MLSRFFDEKVEKLAQHYYSELKRKKKVDRVSPTADDFDTVNLKTLKNKDIREVGVKLLCFQAFRQLKIDPYLYDWGWNNEQVNLATIHIISRAVYPASELKTVSWIKDNFAVCELRYRKNNQRQTLRNNQKTLYGKRGTGKPLVKMHQRAI